jgi:hypothetical protein
MIVRDEGERGVLAIGQASHAWISGQLARAWGNHDFGTVEPWEEVCLAAEQHDVGMARWDLMPNLDPTTQLPLSFTDMPLDLHMSLWRQAPGRLLSQSRYAALLVSMHAVRLYERRDLNRLEPPEAEQVRDFLSAQREFQRAVGATLAADRAAIARNSDLIWTWDSVSLAVCLDWAPFNLSRVPTSGGAVDLQLLPDGERRVRVTPWPFAAAVVSVHADGRRLAGRYATERALREALAVASWETVVFELRSA